MAVSFSAGDIVTPTLQSSGSNSFARGALGPGMQPFGGPPVGTVTGGTLPAGPVDVNWSGQNGSFANPVSGIEAIALDILTDADSNAVDEFLGRVVRVKADVSQESPEFQGSVVSLYIRNVGGDTAAATPTLALVKLNDGTFREVETDQLEVVPGR